MFFIASQLVLVLICFEHTSHPLASIIALVAVCSAVLLVTHGQQRRPRLIRASLVVACILASSSMVFFLDPDPAAPRYEVWFLLANAFVLLALAFQKRAAAAMIGLALMSGVVLLGSVMNSTGLYVGVALLVRPILVFALAAVCAAPLRRMQRSIHGLRSAERAVLARATFASTHTEQRRRHAEDIRGLAGNMLDVLSAGHPLTSDQVTECLALGGHLRDRVRGDRLVAGPLIDAVWQARVRGVDVLLLDDSRGQNLPAVDLDSIRLWMSEQLALVEHGTFTGRLLPPGRSEIATSVCQHQSTSLRRFYGHDSSIPTGSPDQSALEA